MLMNIGETETRIGRGSDDTRRIHSGTTLFPFWASSSPLPLCHRPMFGWFLSLSCLVSFFFFTFLFLCFATCPGHPTFSSRGGTHSACANWRDLDQRGSEKLETQKTLFAGNFCHYRVLSIPTDLTAGRQWTHLNPRAGCLPQANSRSSWHRARGQTCSCMPSC